MVGERLIELPKQYNPVDFRVSGGQSRLSPQDPTLRLKDFEGRDPALLAADRINYLFSIFPPEDPQNNPSRYGSVNKTLAQKPRILEHLVENLGYTDASRVSDAFLKYENDI